MAIINPENQVLERRAVPKGSFIIREGDSGNCAFLVQSGKVRVYVQHDDKDVELAKLGPGQIFGEMALVFDEKRSATVQAIEDSVLVVITRQTLDDKLRKSDPTVRAIVPMLMKRIIQTNSALINRHGDIKILVETVQNIYETIIVTLPRVQQQSFQNAVQPKLNQFLAAVQSFQEKYSDD